ncbi:MAG TPA: aldehyde dehydrogenase family protein [Pseudonocardiaceae bacterium]|jgi:aldehyde dehydrogenase (NAD+)
MTIDQFGSEPRLLIGGDLRKAVGGREFTVLNPATEEVVGAVADGTAEDMDAAIAAARRAFDDTGWASDRDLRKQVLAQLRDAIAADLDTWRAELVAESGCPVALTYSAQLDGPARDNFDWAIGMIDSFGWEREAGVVENSGSASRAMVVKEALGVVGAIVPWNFPVEVTLTKIVSALAAGNTVVLKPAPDTPLNATRLGRLVAEHTDMPPGVFNVVPSSDHLLGEVLTTDRRVDAISFTGSTATGRRIMGAAAPTLKRLFLELGGKSAHIMLDDAALPDVVRAITTLCVHAGQGCAMNTRLLLPRSHYADGVDMLTHAFAHFPYGDPTDPNVYMGPVISERQRQRVLGYVAKGVAEGARLATGGGIPDHLPTGFFLQPTLFVDVDNSSTIAQQEIFGPVLCVIPYDSEEDAVRIANDSDYGLSGAVSSASPERALAVARRIRTGTISVNNGTYFRRDLPFGGYKASGIGRQTGREGFEGLLETKTIGLPV